MKEKIDFSAFLCSNASTHTGKPLMPCRIENTDDPFFELSIRRENALRPLRAMIELTARCQFACPHCFQISRAEPELSTSEEKELLLRFKSEGVLCMTFTGGEPLLRDDIFELIGFARDNHFVVRLMTNGALVDEKAADEIARLAVQSVEISLYGASPETYQKITGEGGAFEKTIQGLKNLLSRGVLTRIKFPIMEDNAPDLVKMRSLANGLKVSASMFYNWHRRDDGSMPGALSPRTEQAVLELWHGETRPIPQAVDLDLPICDIARKGITIGPRGEIFPCPLLRISVGNTRFADVYDVWENAPLLKKLRAYKVRDMKECACCDAISYCHRCPVMFHDETGDFLTPAKSECRRAFFLKNLAD